MSQSNAYFFREWVNGCQAGPGRQRPYSASPRRKPTGSSWSRWPTWATPASSSAVARPLLVRCYLTAPIPWSLFPESPPHLTLRFKSQFFLAISTISFHFSDISQFASWKPCPSHRAGQGHSIGTFSAHPECPSQPLKWDVALWSSKQGLLPLIPEGEQETPGGNGGAECLPMTHDHHPGARMAPVGEVTKTFAHPS